MRINYRFLSLLIILFFTLPSLKAQFSVAFAPANWGTVAVNSDGITNSGGAPTSIFMTSGDNQSGTLGTNDYSIAITQSGLLTFNWSYSTNDGAPFDYPLFVVNGVATIVNGYSTSGNSTQSGSQPCIPLSQGDVFRFRMLTTDNVVGAATCVFTNFVFSTGNLTITPASPSVCPGGTIALTASGGSNYSWSGGITNGVAFSPTASSVYTVSSGLTGCIVTNTISLVFNPPLTISGPTSNICANGAATLIAGGGTTYSWSTGATTPSIVVTPAVSSTYTVFGTSTGGCNTQGVGTITVNAAVPTLTVSGSVSSGGACPNSPVTLLATGATSYSWTNSVVNGVPFPATTTNTFTVTGFNACGSATAAISVSIHPLPPVTASVNNPTICSGASAVLNGGGAVTYTWTSLSGQITNNTAFFPTVSGSYTVRGTSAIGCTASAVANVTVLLTPTITPVVTPTAICLGTTATLSATGATGYTWSPGTGLNNPTAVVSPSLPTLFTLFRSNGVCTSTANVFLQVNPIPNVNAFATPTVICVGDPTALNVIGAISYTWLPGNFSASNFTLFPNASTNYTVTASNGSCTASSVVQLSVNPSPVVGINTPTIAVCEGSSVVLTATGNAPTYTWLPGPVIGNSYTVTPTATALYTLMGTNSSNCTSQQTQLIIANPLPVLTLSSSVAFACSGQAAGLSILNPNMANVVYNWANNASAGPNTNVSPTITTNYVANGTNTVTGCTNSNTLTLAVFISTFVVSSPTAICRGSLAILNASGAAVSYTWSANGGVFTPSVSVSPTITTNYTVTGLTGNCASSSVIAVIVNSLPNVIASAVKPQLCRLEFGTVTASGANSYTWNTGATTQAISYSTLTVTTTFTVTGTDVNGCVKTATVTQFIATCPGFEILNRNANIILEVYPNPNNGNFTISSDASINIDIVNAFGQVVFSTQLLKEHKKDLTVDTLPNGIYFITGENNGLKINKKIVIEK